uniref:Uncharacterized protein n=1 Tax=Anopheles quadriannulatus TaxID=34691 RepID=A0A182XCX1_ANOQN
MSLKGNKLIDHNRQKGICPGNRLKIIQSHDSGCFTLSPASSPCPTIDSTTNLNSPIPSEIYENTSLCSSTSTGSQRQGKRRSWHIMPNKDFRKINFQFQSDQENSSTRKKHLT